MSEGIEIKSYVKLNSGCKIFWYTVKLLIRLAGLIIFLKLKMRVLLEIKYFYLLNFKIIAGLIRNRVLLEGEPY